MKIVLQRVQNASVTVGGEAVGEIGKGLLLFMGVGEGDTKEITKKMIEKIYKLRIFEDDNGKTNLSCADVGAEVLLISQFTLYANCKKGNRPSFIEAAKPDKANELYEYAAELCGERFSKTQTGVFGADMKVSLLNDGPFTIALSSDELI